MISCDCGAIVCASKMSFVWLVFYLNIATPLVSLRIKRPEMDRF
ncbi:hypothetical protein SynPROS71_01631 [Synechococcus sp. PROS-7-1]|nr:hypothetical protein SynPROS71_01631 [Synechococcus sp. PROS-7-1]